MKPLTNPENFAFTNHFNQSMLKKRIQMMNTSAVFWKSAGKYSAFLIIILSIVAVSNPKYQSPSKYLIRTETTIEWVITPKISLIDLAKIQAEIQGAGFMFKINQYKLDPLEKFICGIHIHSSYSYYWAKDMPIHPITSSFGKLSLTTKQQVSELPSPSLKEIARKDSIEAQKTYLTNQLQYEIEELREIYGSFGDQVRYFSVKPFAKPISSFFTDLTQNPILKDNVSPQEILKTVATLHKNQKIKLRLNGSGATYEYIQKLPLKDIKEFFTIDVYDPHDKFSHKTLILIHTY